MTATVQPESKSPSRRALLAGALGGIGALAASAIGRASPVRATHEGYLQVSHTNPATATTRLTNAANNSLVMEVASSAGGIALAGTSNSSYGLRGISGSGVAVYAQSNSSLGIYSVSQQNTGIYGVSNATNGVYGLCAPGTGVFGNSATGKGVHGLSGSGVGGHFSSSTGLALQTAGRTKFSTSGVATITAGSTTKTITPGVNVTSGSFVLLTPKANIGTRALWFITDAANNKFTIRMSSSRSSGTKVAWLLLG